MKKRRDNELNKKKWIHFGCVWNKKVANDLIEIELKWIELIYKLNIMFEMNYKKRI